VPAKKVAEKKPEVKKAPKSVTKARASKKPAPKKVEKKAPVKKGPKKSVKK
jgi:hypothetical protein